MFLHHTFSLIQRAKLEEITFPLEFIFVFILYFIGVIKGYLKIKGWHIQRGFKSSAHYAVMLVAIRLVIQSELCSMLSAVFEIRLIYFIQFSSP